MKTIRCTASLVALFAAVLTACGGGDDSSPAPAPTPSPGGNGSIGSPSPGPAPVNPPASTPTEQDRINAATSTAQSNPLCDAIRPFYWEVGDENAKLASASVGAALYAATTGMNIASASKWIYAAYVAQLKDGALDDNDVKFLTFRSGYTQMGAFSCASAATVDTCLNLGTNGVHNPLHEGKFFYNGGHMQRHAHDIGLGSLNSAGLASEVQATIGDFGFSYASPQPPGGVFTTPEGYAGFLRKMLAGDLQLGSQLGSHAVCTNPDTCAEALDTPPIPRSESWHYSLGHWVEDDPTVGDGAFSSAGAFGFYPWIDSTQKYYGIVARESFTADAGYHSAQCGRLIRKAWMTGAAQ